MVNIEKTLCYWLFFILNKAISGACVIALRFSSCAWAKRGGVCGFPTQWESLFHDTLQVMQDQDTHKFQNL